MGFGGHWRFLTWVWHLDLDFDMVIGSLSWFSRFKEHPYPLSLDLGLWRMLEIPSWGLASWFWLRYCHWSLMHPYSEFLLPIMILDVQRKSMSFKSWLGAFEDAGGSWLGFGIWILIWIWSIVFDTPMFQILAVYLAFEDAWCPSYWGEVMVALGLWTDQVRGPKWGLQVLYPISLARKRKRRYCLLFSLL